MPSKTFSTGRIRRADYDAQTQQLDLCWDNKTVLAYKQVPAEVFRRLCSAPNPTTYWEDRIEQEYPKAQPQVRPTSPEAGPKLSDLFGGG